jgi:nucleoside-diphosphate-sugar epimerase
MPTNLYGPGDSYHPTNSHVLPALIRRFHEAGEAGLAEVVAWGTGTPRREFLFVDDLADACAFLLGVVDPPDWINVGTGTDVTIRELTEQEAAETMEPLVSKFSMVANGKAHAIGAPFGFVKLVADPATRRLVGAHIVAPHASDLISELTLAHRANLTIDEQFSFIMGHVHRFLVGVNS